MRWISPNKVTPATGFIEPCIPTVAKRPPAGESWIFELKWGGYRLLVRKREDVVRVYTRGADWTKRFPRVLEAVRQLKARGIEFNAHIEGDGDTIFEHVCNLGYEGIIAKRKDLAL